MGVYGSAEKVLFIHSPSKAAGGPPAASALGAAGPRIVAAPGPRAQAGGGAVKRPKQARAKAAPKKHAGKFAAPVRRPLAPKQRKKEK